MNAKKGSTTLDNITISAIALEPLDRFCLAHNFDYILRKKAYQNRYRRACIFGISKHYQIQRPYLEYKFYMSEKRVLSFSSVRTTKNKIPTTLVALKRFIYEIN